MALQPGSRLGVYEVVGLLGAGGMGEVYRARDMRLNRDVAIKVLPDSVALDSDRLARLQREAQVLASLNHANIAVIHGLEDAHALVMELVEGPTLADRIAEGAIPLDEAIPIAKQIAEALEAAHEIGVIHRDLKPANIKVRSDGTVKVLDFGLAKVLEPAFAGAPAVSASPTLTTPMMTGAGVILGTAAYMSPEQARGKPADKRSDLWAFGCVLFEMLSGTRAFEGEEVTDILAAIVRAEPDWNRLPRSTPPTIRTLLRRVLQKDRALRLRDAGDARLELQEALSSPGSEVHGTRFGLAEGAGAAAVATLLVVAAFVAGQRWRGADDGSPVSTSPTHLTLAVPPGVLLAPTPPAMSPDGQRVAYAGIRDGVQRLYVQDLRGRDADVLSGTEGATSPSFSPDGDRLAFIAGGKLKVISVGGGVPLTLHDAGNQAAAWTAPDTIVFRSAETALLRISASGGSTSVVVPNAPDTADALLPTHPDVLPDGKSILVSSSAFNTLTADDKIIEVISPESGARKTIISGGSYARYLPSGHLIFLRSGKVLAAAFDVAQLRAGTPVEVLNDVRETVIGQGFISCSRTGSCVYAAGGLDGALRTVVLVDRNGKAEPLPLTAQGYNYPRFSPDGQKLAFWIQRNRCDLLVYDLGRRSSNHLTIDGDSHVPVWGPASRLIYVSNRATARSEYELFSKSADGSGSEERLTAERLNLGAVAPLAWSPAAGVVVFPRAGDLWVLPLSGQRKATRYFPSAANETTPAVSANGKWLAYSSDEGGRPQVHVRAFPNPGEKIVISSDGGTEPKWSSDRRELYFRNGDEMMVVKILSESPFITSTPTVLFRRATSRAQTSNVINSYDVAPDGRFVMIDEEVAPDSDTHLNVVLNWFDELKRRVPTK